MQNLGGLRPRHFARPVILFFALFHTVCAVAQEAKDATEISLYDRFVALGLDHQRLIRCGLLVLEEDQSILCWDCDPEIYLEFELGGGQILLNRSYEGRSLASEFEETFNMLPNDPEIEERLSNLLLSCEAQGCESSQEARSALTTLQRYFSAERVKVQSSNLVSQMEVFGDNHGYFVAFGDDQIIMLDTDILQLGDGHKAVNLYRLFVKFDSSVPESS